jgi:hypothetical protein
VRLQSEDPFVIRSLARLAFCAALALPLAGTATPSPDWDAVADVGTVEVITHDEDGEARETKIWLVVLDGQGFIRTGSSRWGENVERDPDVVLRIDGAEYPLRAEFIENDAHREQIVAAFRDKYGWVDGLLNVVRGSHPKIMHLLPR